jgi:SAM-dependent methyltransferase
MKLVMSTLAPPEIDLALFERVACNICGSHETRQVLQKWSYSLVQCVECGLVYTNPRAFRIEADDYFENAYLSTIEKDGRLDPGIELYVYADIIYNLNNRVALGKLLDVGCAMGHFLEFARRYGWDVEGVECSPYAARYGAERFGLKVHPVCVLSDAHLQPDSYTCCVMVEVVEHLPDPRETLNEIWRVLQPGGIVYLTTPNFASYRSLMLREDWHAVIPIGHLYYFDSASLGKLLASVGFIDVENLTAEGEFDKDLEFARNTGLMKMTEGQLDQLQHLPAADRAEGLVMCARKPWDSVNQRLMAVEKLVRQPFKMSFDGCLVRRPGETPEDQKVYYVENGRKRWVTTSEWIVQKGLRWPEDVQFITAAELDAILPGPTLP